MSKFVTIGYIARAKKDPSKHYLKIALPQGLTEVVLKNGDFVNLSKPMKGREQSEEAFEEMLTWKKFSAFIATEE